MTTEFYILDRKGVGDSWKSVLLYVSHAMVFMGDTLQESYVQPALRKQTRVMPLPVCPEF